MIEVRQRLPSRGRCLNGQNKSSGKLFRKTRKARGMKVAAIVLITVAALSLTAAISTILHRLLTSPTKTVAPADIFGSIRSLINTDNIREHLRFVTKKPHVSGSENNLKVAKYIRQQLINQGLENVHFNEYNVLLSYPNFTTPNTVEILGEDGKSVYKTSGRSPSLVKEEQNDPTAEIQWLAYSANGIAEGDVVYVNTATKQDYEHLESMQIDLKGKIFLARYSIMFRGNIAMMAMNKGAIGCLIYSDPVQVASLGTSPKDVFTNTDKMPPNATQRGTIYVGSGDPRTPAFPSIPELFRERSEEELYAQKLIPTIPVLPITYATAQVLFENMKGAPVIPEFRGKLNVTYRYGPGLINNQKLRMTVHAKNEDRTIQNVLGFIRGGQEPEKYVILSNHYDAWTYGAVDPNSGTATLLELSRVLKAYQNSTGWVPARSILIAHWDAEEYGLIGATEFAEEYRVQLMRKAVAVINMDVIGGNQTLHALANPTLAKVLREAAASVTHPNEDEQKAGRHTLYDSWKHFNPSKNNRSSHPHQRIPAGGSDHMPFYNYLGIPVIFFITTSVDAPLAYPLYHTIYETPYLTENILFPEYKMHKAIGEMFIEMALIFAESKILPYDLVALMDEAQFDYLPNIEEHLNRAAANGSVIEYLKPGNKQFKLLQKTVEELSILVHKRNVTKLASLPFSARVDENNRLIEFEKCFINPHGAEGNPQARHLLYNPSTEDWYNGGAIPQVHNLISKIASSSDEKMLKVYSKKLAKEIALVHFAFICAKHTLDELISL